MLVRLELENFLLFEKAGFAFSPGLNAVSGETGAGKSLVARALGLALGGRGGQDVIRAGCEEAKIRAVFRPRAAADSPAASLVGPDGMVTVERVLKAGGGSLSVNGKAATAQAVRQALAPLVDFAAQNEHMRLADPAHQLELLDAYGKLGPALEAFQSAYRAAESLNKRLKAGREERELVRLRLERAKGELADLEAAAYDPAADLRLEDEIREMSHSAAVVQAAAEAAAFLEEGEPSAIEALSAARRALERMVEISPRLADAAGELDEALEQVESALSRLADVADEEEADPATLDRMIGRSEKLKSLAKRFGCKVDGLDAVKDRLEKEIGDLSGWDAGEEETRAKLAELLPAVAASGTALGASRRQAAERLARTVNRELAGLGMEQAGFETVFEPLWSEGMPLEDILNAGPSGLDEVNFFISPNPGEAASAVAAGASGGEASRAVLALKAALSDVYRPEVMFLDEIDAGVGARLGRELGVKLQALAAGRQVVVITHLPQIAAYAETHLKVEKKVRDGRTMAYVEKLSDEGRVREVASMIHGSSAGEVTMKQAREMLREGGNAVE